MSFHHSDHARGNDLPPVRSRIPVWVADWRYEVGSVVVSLQKFGYQIVQALYRTTRGAKHHALHIRGPFSTELARQSQPKTRTVEFD